MLELGLPPGPDAPAAWRAIVSPTGMPELIAFREGVYEARSATGTRAKLEIKPLPAPLEVHGPWSLRFPPNWGAPSQVTLDKLISWTDHAEAGIRYFSGTAEYETTFDVPAHVLGSGKVLELDLGSVREIAEVTLNGSDLGIWWKPPFAADVSALVKPGTNTLKVRVTNLWMNRLIGDEQFPDDCEWNGKPIKEWPRWMVDGAPRPVRDRLTFTTWKHYNRDSVLVDSGLLGPVTLRPAARVPVTGAQD